MEGRLWLHIRDLPNGRVIVTPVPFTAYGADAPTLEAARTAALEKAKEDLGELSAPARAALTLETTASLATAELELPDQPGASGGMVGVRLSLVVLERPGSQGTLCTVLAPGVGRWSLSGPDRESLLAAAKPSLEQFFGDWPPATVALQDDIGEVRLEPVDVALDPEPEPETQPPRRRRIRMPGQPPVEDLGDDLTELARAGRLGRLDRREPLVDRVLAILAGEGRASAMLVGQPDVGKTALVHEIAFRLGTGEVPPALVGRRMLRISANELIAGAQYTGQWQGRARNLIEVGREGAIIVMDDPRGIVDAGRWSQSDNNVARLMLPYIQRGEVNLICEATADSLAAARTQEPSFVEAFQRVEVPEPDAEAAREILTLAVRRIEANHGVRFDADGVPAALDLTRRFEPYRALPGKAVRLLEETAQTAAQARPDPAASGADAPLGREAVTRSFAGRTGLPVAMLSDAVPLKTDEVRGFFDERVLGQPEAVEEMVDLVAVIKAALNDPAKPLASLFFVGPTGVGKTELCKALAEYLFGSRERVIRFDMGEFASGDAAARLVGSAWERGGGTAGEGELTRRLREQPFCVLLLDEIEKAHRSVFDVLLGALGEARVTDAQGRTADLHNAIVIMTSNLGASRGENPAVGFGQVDAGAELKHRRAHFVKEAEAFFRPEFFNRIDRVLVFDPLARETILRIARRELGRLLLREGITRRQLLVEIDPALPDLIAATGFHPRYGARPLHREIERAVIRPLARVIVEQRPSPGDLIQLRPGDGAVEISVSRIREAPPRPKRERPASDETSNATLDRAAKQAQELHDAVRAELAGDAITGVQSELSRRLSAVNDPGFWDDPAAAQSVLARTYELQRVLDHAHHIASRAEGLVELAVQIGRLRDRGRLGDLRAGLEEVEDQLLLIRLQAAGAGSGDTKTTARLSVTPVGADSREWADRVVAMYAAWAERGGREHTVDAETRTVVIASPGVHALLAGEAGLHRHEAAAGRRELARVTLLDASHGLLDASHGLLDASHGDSGGTGPGTVVRVYASGPRTGVRDPRTRVSIGNLEAVLDEGRIDEFLLATVARAA